MADKDESQFKYPLPFDAFMVLTQFTPGAIVFLLLPSQWRLLEGTVLYEVLRSEAWYVYGAFVLVAFILSALVDAVGKLVRTCWQRRSAKAKQESIEGTLEGKALAHTLSFDPEVHSLKANQLRKDIDRMIAIVAQTPVGGPSGLRTGPWL